VALTLPARGYAGYFNEGGARDSLIRFSRALFPSASASPIVSKEMLATKQNLVALA
jgi:hypothetical protein